MKINGADPDLETLVGRINKKEIDLQPDFQRGEIWSDFKRKRLIDSILRGWHIPPVHFVIDQELGTESVLDGQQRLAAIRDFFNDGFPIDGNIEPEDGQINLLHGKRYSDLPPEWVRKINRYTLRVLSLTDYLPQEPGELFFRLNQPVSLTPAEQRNAFFGGARGQVRQLVREISEKKVDQAFWAFTNVRMSYDDVVARAAFLLDNGSLNKRVTSTDLANIYRYPGGFSQRTVERLNSSIQIFTGARREGASLRLNKSMAQSWLLFVAVADRALVGGLPSQILAKFISGFSFLEFREKDTAVEEVEPAPTTFLIGEGEQAALPVFSFRSLTSPQAALRDYRDRASSRVADVSSVVVRDFALWYLFLHFCREDLKGVHDSYKAIHSLWTQVRPPNSIRDYQSAWLHFAAGGWGDQL